MKSIFFTYAVVYALVVACTTRQTQEVPKETPLPRFDFTQLSNRAFLAKQVGISGYIGEPFEYTFNLIDNQDTSTRFYSLPLYERKNQCYAYPSLVLSVRVSNSSELNTIDPLPAKYDLEKVRITGQIGPDIHVNDFASVSGILITGNEKASLIVSVIAQRDDSLVQYENLKVMEFPGAALAPDSLKGKLFWVKGILDQEEVSNLDKHAVLKLEQGNSKNPIRIAFVYGNGSSRIEEDSHIIHDDQRKPINFKLPVKIYGVWDGTSVWAESISNQ